MHSKTYKISTQYKYILYIYYQYLNMEINCKFLRTNYKFKLFSIYM